MDPYQQSPPQYGERMYQQPRSPPNAYARHIPTQSYAPAEFYGGATMSRGATNDSRRSNTSITSETRPGHFSDLAKFAQCLKEDVQLEGIDPQPAAYAWLEPGMIVRIHDDLSRLNRRVMLIVRTHRGGSSLSMTCLSFCKHENRHGVSPGFKREHAVVVDGREHQAPMGRFAERHTNENQIQSGSIEMATLKVLIGSNAMVSQLEPDVWINIREIWNVDLGVRVAILGQVEPQSFALLLRKVKELFCETLGDADLGAQRSRPPDSPRQRAAQMASGVRSGIGRQERRPSFAERLAGVQPLFR